MRRFWRWLTRSYPRPMSPDPMRHDVEYHSRPFPHILMTQAAWDRLMAKVPVGRPAVNGVDELAAIVGAPVFLETCPCTERRPL